MKIVVDTADTSSIVDLDQIRPEITAKNESGPVHIGRHDPALVREDKLFNLRLPAVRKLSKSAEYQQHNWQPASHWQAGHHDGWQNNL